MIITNMTLFGDLLLVIYICGHHRGNVVYHFDICIGEIHHFCSITLELHATTIPQMLLQIYLVCQAINKTLIFCWAFRVGQYLSLVILVEVHKNKTYFEGFSAFPLLIHQHYFMIDPRSPTYYVVALCLSQCPGSVSLADCFLLSSPTTQVAISANLVVSLFRRWLTETKKNS